MCVVVTVVCLDYEQTVLVVSIEIFLSRFVCFRTMEYVMTVLMLSVSGVIVGQKGSNREHNAQASDLKFTR